MKAIYNDTCATINDSIWNTPYKVDKAERHKLLVWYHCTISEKLNGGYTFERYIKYGHWQFKKIPNIGTASMAKISKRALRILDKIENMKLLFTAKIEKVIKKRLNGKEYDMKKIIEKTYLL